MLTMGTIRAGQRYRSKEGIIFTVLSVEDDDDRPLIIVIRTRPPWGTDFRYAWPPEAFDDVHPID